LHEYLGVRRWRIALREAAWVFGLSRLMLVLITILSIFFAPQLVEQYKHNLSTEAYYKYTPYSPSTLFYSWLRWDAKSYLNISYFGYKHTPDVAFFPMWPLIQHYGGLLLGGSFPSSFYMSGLLLANICFYFTLVLLYHLLAEDFDPATARRSLIYCTFAPYALFFFAGYSESLFVLLCIAVFLLIRRGKTLHWWLAGFLGFLATLTRSTGIFLVIPFLVLYLQRFWSPSQRMGYTWQQKLNALIPIVLIPAGILVYMLYLYYAKGNPLIFTVEEGAFWYRHFAFPWQTFGMVMKASFSQPSFAYLLEQLLTTTFTIIPLVALALGWKHLPLHYSLFALALVVFDLSFPGYTVQPLFSQPRFLLAVFPITVIFAIWGKRPRLNQCFLAFSLIFFVINAILFVGNFWVA
jgi:mannosyltransferase PIG-V